MLTFQSLLLSAVCLCSRAVPLETLRHPGGDDTDAASDRVTRTHTIDSFSNSSLLTISSQTSAPHVQQGGDEEQSERFGREADAESVPWFPAPTDLLGASDEDRKLGVSDEDKKLGESDEDRKLGASDEDRKLGESDEDRKLGSSDEDRSGVDTSTTTPSGDSAGPTLLDAADTWTEAVHLRTGEVSASSQELGTEATMSSEDLPLIFEPFEDVTVSMDTGHTSSDVRLSATSGARASVTGSHPSEEQNDDITQSSVTRPTPTVLHDPPSEDLESKEEPEEDEEDSDEEEEESEEDLMESTITPHTRPPYSLIPPPPIWVQRNQGLVRSWVELIREKAGYVSGMLAPVGIGIAGALLLVGALYSIRLIHRKRRDSFKHQRRKPPREVRSGPDNAMLLADSSEDEF